MPLARGARLGPYEIVSPLGEGGMGEVYRARDTRLAREVAIKILPDSVASDPDRLMRFEREAKTLASLNHPHIAQIYGIEESHMKGGPTGTPISALVMELVEGDTLAERIARGPLPMDDAVAIARQIIDALQAAHDAGIVHRDLKPANIKVRSDGTVKVLDFGLARSGGVGRAVGAEVLDSPTFTAPAFTMQGVILGTAAYMSPEQARGKDVDHRADIWAFGCVLYKMLTAKQPFAGETVSDSIAAILGREPNFEQLPGNTPASIRRLLRRCLARDPRARLQHIDDGRLELADVQSSALEVAPHQSSSAGRRLALAALSGAVVGAAALYIGLRATTPAAIPPQPVHLAVPVPEPNSAANGVLVSPDGRHIVTMASGGVPTLHVLAGSLSRTLEGIARCWSPDSRSLVLHRFNGELVRMDVSGGPPVAFADALRPGVGSGFGGGWGCSWNASGTLLLDDARSLHALTISSGAMRTVELDDSASEETRRYRPQFLPDGRRFLYWWVTADGERTVRVGSLDSRQTTAIVASDAPAVYTRGYLLFQRGATLVAQAFDERSLALIGEPQAITTEAAPGSISGLAFFDVSETGMLVFATTNGGVRGHHVWVDRRGGVLGTVPQLDGAELLNLSLSPDGTRVAGTRMDPSTGNWDIWTVDLQSGVPTRLTTQPGIDSEAIWSPDGSEIAYVSSRRDAAGIYRLSLKDGTERILLKASTESVTFEPLRTTDWTRDGRFIVYQRNGDIMALPVASSGEPLSVVATPGRERNGKVSRDGRWIAFQSQESNANYIYVQPFPGPGTRSRVSASIGFHPQWRQDGLELLWATPSPSNPSLETVYSADLTFVGNAVRATTPKPVFPPHVNFASLIDNRPHWTVAADGQRFLLRQADGLPGPAVKVILNWQALLRVP
jgi:Tol biopolymer transport system component